MKILDLAKLFVADALMKKKIKKFSFTPSQSTLKYGSENRLWVRGLKYFKLNFEQEKLPKTNNEVRRIMHGVLCLSRATIKKICRSVKPASAI